MSSNLTASAKHIEQEPHELGLFFVSSWENQACVVMAQHCGCRCGLKSWLVYYDRDGRRREIELGAFTTVNLALTRKTMRACRLVLVDKRDPLVERDKARAGHAQRQARQVRWRPQAWLRITS